MEKKGGLAAGAILAAGMLLRPYGAVSPKIEGKAGSSAPTVASAGASALKVSGEGPWVASCKYWASARGVPDETDDANGDFQEQVSATGSGIDAHVAATVAKPKAPCPGAQKVTDAQGHLRDDPWGIPAEGVAPDITAVLATVPDPLHAHQALAFDRTMDALLQAAADNGYVQSYFWLPWKPVDEELQEGDPSPSVRAEHRHERERYPGLVVLRYVPSSSKEHPLGPEALRSQGFGKLIYLFVVAETPISGVNGEELNHALQFEGDLRQRKGVCAHLSTWRPDELSVIGPSSSASVYSLAAGLDRGLAQLAHTFAHQAPCERPGAQEPLSLPLTHLRVSSSVSWPSAESVFDSLKAYNVVSHSFAADGRYLESKLEGTLSGSFPSWTMVQLSEDGTTSPQMAVQSAEASTGGITGQVATIRYPRGISLLRNAHTDASDATQESATAGAPYLKMSLHDASREEQIPRFSFEQLPLSQEAQLMAIVRQLRRSRAQFVTIRATDTLDSIFLEKFLHRALPDIRVVTVGGGDLLYEREVDNVPFVGGITLTPYNLVAPVSSLGSAGVRRPFADSGSQQIYNSASYAMFEPQRVTSKNVHLPKLANYGDLLHEQSGQEASHPLLWATVVGRDGYFPLGVLNNCASDDSHFLPSLKAQGEHELAEAGCDSNTASKSSLTATKRIHAAPPLSWSVLCVLVILACACHVVAFCSADLWSSFSRDLNIEDNDEPYRRALYIHIGAVMLFCMSFVVAWPVFGVHYLFDTGDRAPILGALTLIAGLAALGVSLWKTRRWSAWRRSAGDHGRAGQRTLLQVFHTVAHLATLMIPLCWFVCCGGSPLKMPTLPYTGLFFSNRCLDVFSGVSPIPPVLFLLVGWFVWSVMQTRRLRFSESTRPRLPGHLDDDDEFYFVSDESVNNPRTRERLPLVESLTCLLITPTVLQLFGFRCPHHASETGSGRTGKFLSPTTLYCIAVYMLLLLAGMWFIAAWSPERLLRSTGSFPAWLPRAAYLASHAPTLYEALYKALFLSLMVIASTGALRCVLIWGSLNRGILRKLERVPMRVAFTRLKGLGWFTLMRQNGLVQRRREMSRSLESMRQLTELAQTTGHLEPQSGERWMRRQLRYGFQKRHALVHCHAKHLTALIENWPHNATIPLFHPENAARVGVFESLPDLPDEPEHQVALGQIYFIEQGFADFGRQLLQDLLIPYWRRHRHDYVESGEDELGEHKSSQLPGRSPEGAVDDNQVDLLIGLAEEFLALRYISLIRAVLVNVRHLMTFVSVAFVMAIMSWNVYPFRPREAMDTLLTGLLLALSACAVWVFAQMYRDPTLSRITDTRPNELGWEFWGRLATFGALPVLTWLAYQFPAISDTILRYVEPGLEAVK